MHNTTIHVVYIIQHISMLPEKYPSDSLCAFYCFNKVFFKIETFSVLSKAHRVLVCTMPIHLQKTSLECRLIFLGIPPLYNV